MKMSNKRRTQAGGLDLSSLFKVATQVLAANQKNLNKADTYNQDHGDNMVQVFDMISQAVEGQRGKSPSRQLAHASQYLSENGKSGSAHVYAQQLAQASQQFKGQSGVTPDNAMMLIQGLLGGGQQSASQSGEDLLSTLLGGGQPAQQASQDQDGFDLGDLLNAGMTFMNAKQQGQSNLQAGLAALLSDGPMAQRPYRQQSGQLVANALLQAVANMSKR
jgi:hypothetical protein